VVLGWTGHVSAEGARNSLLAKEMDGFSTLTAPPACRLQQG
jgi:hypothetical protein